ncbi:MAG: DUF2835 domain-containing protein [Gammaproteobacteria bacterium]|nr:DUF2835 domain-containing protein [Gammaproteobacteria bacterium]MDH5592078.1 DUF2835 domain-containing protein [Gammaproteobacteria bacterium]
MATELRFRLKLTQEQALRYYQGSARAVVVRAENGQRVQFPAEHIRQFIDQDGVQGYFSIQFDDNQKLIGIKRL